MKTVPFPVPPKNPTFPSGRCAALGGLVASALALFPGAANSSAAGVTEQKDISYLSAPSQDAYETEQCRLDVYLPKDATPDTPVLVWFHGGGLKGGARSSGGTVAAAKSLAENGVCVIVPSYRLSPKVTFPTYLEDAAKAVRWAVDHAGELKVRPKVFVGGHSAGGYLAALLAMDPRYLTAAGVRPDQIAGYVCMSAQMMTHFTVAEERGISSEVLTADDAAPIHFLRKDTAPMLILTGDDDWPARLEENAYFVAAMRRVADNRNLSFQVVAGRNHGGILQSLAQPAEPAAKMIREFLTSGVLPPDHPPTAQKSAKPEPAAPMAPAGNP
jgi:acetyl esterase/lipase